MHYLVFMVVFIFLLGFCEQRDVGFHGRTIRSIIIPAKALGIFIGMFDGYFVVLIAWLRKMEYLCSNIIY